MGNDRRNVGVGFGCFLWDISGYGNSTYLDSINNGLGMHTTIWWSWEAANNTHNVPSGSDPSDPFACTSSFPTSYETTQCAVAFDGTGAEWS